MINRAACLRNNRRTWHKQPNLPSPARSGPGLISSAAWWVWSASGRHACSSRPPTWAQCHPAAMSQTVNTHPKPLRQNIRREVFHRILMSPEKEKYLFQLWNNRSENTLNPTRWKLKSEWEHARFFLLVKYLCNVFFWNSSFLYELCFNPLNHIAVILHDCNCKDCKT